MAVKIRLRRVGAKKQPSYRLVAADERAPRDGRFIEIIGHYNPLTEPPTITVEEERVFHWLKQGARPSEAAARLLAKTGVMERFSQQTGQAGPAESQPGAAEGQ